MNKYTILLWCWLGLALLPSLLYSQDNIRSLQQVQLLSQDECVVVQVNADWNFSANIDLSKLKNCAIFNASIDNPEFGAAIRDEWNVKSVPTIIMFEYGKEIRRFEAGLSFQLDKDTILRKINNEIDDIMLRRFQ
jgi:hypothetical protein|tara:strand:- start:65 stop:469 length:405 start_codon:yes stop_codon:yes gene_type:complete